MDARTTERPAIRLIGHAAGVPLICEVISCRSAPSVPHVLDGSVSLVLADQRTVLKAGEAAEFDTMTPHRIANAGDERPAEIIALYGVQGERVHIADVRAAPLALGKTPCRRGGLDTRLLTRGGVINS